MTAVVAALRLSAEEKAGLQEEANALGITLSTLLYRKVFNDPHAQRTPGPTPAAHKQETLFKMTG